MNEYFDLYGLTDDEKELLSVAGDSLNYEIDDIKGIRFFDPYCQIKSIAHLFRNPDGWTNWSNEA